MKDYRNSMPLQPFPHGLLHPFLGQKEAMCQTLGIRPPSPFSHTRTLALVRSGLPFSWNLGCHACAAWEEEATPIPT